MWPQYFMAGYIALLIVGGVYSDVNQPTPSKRLWGLGITFAAAAFVTFALYSGGFWNPLLQ